MPADYPTEEELERIRKWPFRENLHALMDEVRELWWPFDGSGFTQNGREYRLATGGWSGNEEIIDALQSNEGFFWTLCWQSSHRGGLYIFELP